MRRRYRFSHRANGRYYWESDLPVSPGDSRVVVHDCDVEWFWAPPLADGSEKPWEADDGTRWLHFPAFREWHGWMPGEDGLWVYSEAEFQHAYPEAP